MDEQQMGPWLIMHAGHAEQGRAAQPRIQNRTGQGSSAQVSDNQLEIQTIKS